MAAAGRATEAERETRAAADGAEAAVRRGTRVASVRSIEPLGVVDNRRKIRVPARSDRLGAGRFQCKPGNLRACKMRK
jgi:hypothetical protein